MNKNIVLDYYELFNLNISALGLSVRYYNALLRGYGSIKQIRKIGDLVGLSTSDLLKILNIGEVGVKEIKDKLHQYRLYLSDLDIPNLTKQSYEKALNMYNLREKYNKLKEEHKYEEMLNLDILVLKLDNYFENYLRKENINTLKDLINNKEKLVGLGKNFSKIIIDKVHNLGLSFTCEAINSKNIEEENTILKKQIKELEEKNKQLIISLNRHL